MRLHNNSIKKYLSLVFLIASFSFLLTACNSGIEDSPIDDEPDEVDEVDEVAAMDPNLELASETMPLRASFLSDHESFAYHVNYDGLEMTLVGATQFDGASDAGVSFHVQGGGEITTASFLVEDFDSALLEVNPMHWGEYDVYLSETELDECLITQAHIPYGSEVLQSQLKTCGTDNLNNALFALEKLMSGLELETL